MLTNKLTSGCYAYVFIYRIDLWKLQTFPFRTVIFFSFVGVSLEDEFNLVNANRTGYERRYDYRLQLF